MLSLKPNGQRANQAIFIFWILLFACLCSFTSDLMEYLLLQKNVIDPDAANASDTRQRVVGIFHFSAYIFTIIIFIRWFRRAYYNLHQAYLSGLAYSEGWAAGGWFVPFVNLVVPYRIMKEIWKITQESVRDITYKVNSSIIGWWWAFSIASSLAANNASRLSLRAETVEQLKTASLASIISGALEVTYILITIYLIKKISGFESEFASIVNPEG